MKMLIFQCNLIYEILLNHKWSLLHNTSKFEAFLNILEYVPHNQHILQLLSIHSFYVNNPHLFHEENFKYWNLAKQFVQANFHLWYFLYLILNNLGNFYYQKIRFYVSYIFYRKGRSIKGILQAILQHDCINNTKMVLSIQYSHKYYQ